MLKDWWRLLTDFDVYEKIKMCQLLFFSILHQRLENMEKKHIWSKVQVIFLPFCYPKFSLWYNHGMRHCITKQDVSREWGFSQPAKMQNCHTHIYELKRGHFSSLERQYFAQFLCISFLCFDRCTMGNLVLPWFHLPYITCTTSTLKMKKK